MNGAEIIKAYGNQSDRSLEEMINAELEQATSTSSDLLIALEAMLDKYGNKNPEFWDEREQQARAAVKKARKQKN